MSIFLGGLGLLLLGMNLMTEGLKLASGNALRDILALWTNTRLRGLFSGFLITAIVQSSAAVTIATIGFANAGMLTLERALWVVFGSNVGSTVTGWIVALIGFKLDIQSMALMCVGVGAVLKFSGGQSRRGFIGLALTGLGLLFLGIDFLKEAFEEQGASFQMPSYDDPNLLQVALYIVIGFVLTALMQSSTASMVLILGAAQGGLLSLDAAASVVIGANLGSTTTALIAVIGATSIAKRVALGHVAFNVLTVTVTMFIVGFMLDIVRWVESSFRMVADPATTLAIFHTLFNIIGVLLIWPLASRLAAYLQAHFRSHEETEALPQHLDKNVLPLPYIATDAMALEVSRLNHHTINALRESLGYGLTVPLNFDEKQVVRQLADAIARYGTEINRGELTSSISATLSNLLESTQQYLLVIDITEDLEPLGRNLHEYLPAEVSGAMDNYIARIAEHLDSQDLALPECVRRGTATYDALEQAYRVLKDQVLLAATQGRVRIEEVDLLLQYMNQAKRACRQTMKATERLHAVRDLLQRDLQGNVVPPSPPVKNGEASTTEAPAVEEAPAAEVEVEVAEASTDTPGAQKETAEQP